MKEMFSIKESHIRELENKLGIKPANLYGMTVKGLFEYTTYLEKGIVIEEDSILNNLIKERDKITSFGKKLKDRSNELLQLLSSCKDPERYAIINIEGSAVISCMLDNHKALERVSLEIDKRKEKLRSGLY